MLTETKINFQSFKDLKEAHKIIKKIIDSNNDYRRISISNDIVVYKNIEYFKGYFHLNFLNNGLDAVRESLMWSYDTPSDLVNKLRKIQNGDLSGTCEK